jgi:cytidyltransferase-like protein
VAKKVFVSGCYDMLHSGHIAFFQEAASYGELYVAIGSDATVFELKGRQPLNSEEERLYMVQSVGCVHQAFISSRRGMLDFVEELKQVQPDVFIVNADGSTPAKEKLCRELGIEYLVLQRTPYAALPARSTTALRTMNQIPYRIDLAGGWLDQPFVSELHPGPVITISIEPTIAFNERSGMATSTRNHAIDLWGPKLPAGNPEKLAKILFAWDNPPGTKAISGSQDAIGIVMPGLNCAHYAGGYWPERIEQVGDESTLQFIERSLYLVALDPREDSYDPLADRNLSSAYAKVLSDAALGCWAAILRCDTRGFGAFMRRAFEAQIAMFPHMVNASIQAIIDQYKDEALGWKLSGAGGGGYLIFVAEKTLRNSIQVRIRRSLE